MNELASGQNNTVISVATIAADLHKVNHIAWNVSITAKNAMIISAQAGEKARGFQPITRFIDEIARTTIDSTQQVERESIRLTRLSAHYLRTRDAYTRFNKVRTSGSGARYLDTFLPLVDQCYSQLQAESVQLWRQLQLLNDFLRELDLNMGAALAVASICRIEASRACEYRDNLSVVADSLESAARTIKTIVKDGIDRIQAITITDIN
jgi:hypothetical protein